MDSSKNTKIKSKDITDILKGIRKSKNNFKKANIFLTKEEIKRKIESSIKKIEEDSSTLSTDEKIRYGKIGSSFIRGSEDYFSEFILKLKREERKKLREQNKNLNFDSISKEKLSFKASKKKNKALFGAKLALFGTALAGATYLIKKTYDFFVESPKFTKFKKDLESFLPSSMKFYGAGSKIINENSSSFVVTTKKGEEISTSDETFSKNPIIESASTFDNIFLKRFLKDGLGNFFNNINEEGGQSIIGYFLFKPFTVYVNRTKEYLYDAIQDPKIGKMFRDTFFLIRWIFNSFDLTSLTNQYQGRYASYILKSQDGATNSFAKILNTLREGSGVRVEVEDTKIKTEKIGSFGKNRKIFSNVDYFLVRTFSSDEVASLIYDYIKNNSVEDVMAATKEMKDGIRIEKTKTENHANNWWIITLGASVKAPKHLKQMLSKSDKRFSIFTEGNLSMGGRYKYSHMEKNEQLLEKKLKEHEQDINTTLSKVTEEIPRLLAYHRLNQYYDKQESLFKFMTENNLESVKQYETVNDDLIYFNKNFKIHEKLNFIIRDYFDGRWKYNNFIYKFILMMQENTETGAVQMENSINDFKTRFSPYAHLNEGLKNLNEKDDLGNTMKNYYKNHTILMGQSSDNNVQYGVSNTSFLNTLVNYGKSKINFRRTRLKIFKNLLEKTTDTVMNISVYFGPGLTTNQLSG